MLFDLTLKTIRPQKKNPKHFWVTLNYRGLDFNWGTYRGDERRYLPPAMIMNKRWVTVVEVPVSWLPEIAKMCFEALDTLKMLPASSVPSESEDDPYEDMTEEEEEQIMKEMDALYSPKKKQTGFKESVEKNKELLTKLAKPEPVADDEGPYGLGPCLSGEEYEALSELNKAIHILNMNQKRKKYEPRLTDAGVKDAFMDNFPDREDLFFAAQEAIANGTCTKVT